MVLVAFISRLAMPMIKYFGKEVLNKGVSLGKRLVEDPQIKQAFKDVVNDLASKGLAKIQQKIQRDSGKKRLYKKKRTVTKKNLPSVKKRSRKRVTKKRTIKLKDIFKS